MTFELFEQLLRAGQDKTLTALEQKLFDEYCELREVVIRAMDHHPVLIRDWDRDGHPTIKACSCADCVALRKAIAGIG